MIIYLGIFVILAFLGLSVPDHRAKPIVILAALFFVWFIGGRYFVGCDFSSYVNRYQNVLPLNQMFEDHFATEFGFQFLSSAIKSAGLSFVWLNVAAAFLTVLGISIFALNFRFPILILALLYPIIIIQLGMSGIRQAVALSFLLIGITHFTKGNRFRTAFWIFAGSTFHISVIVLLPISFLAGRTISTTRLIGSLIVVAPVALFIIAPRIEIYEARYVDNVYGELVSGGAIIRYFLIAIPTLLFPFYYRRLSIESPREYPLFQLFAMIAVLMSGLLIFSTVLLHRFNYYVMPVTIVYFVYLSQITFKPSQKLIGKSLPVIIYGTYSLAWFLTSRHADSCYIPYQNFSLL